MTKSIIQMVDKYDENILLNTYEHPTFHNIENAIENITNIGVDALTFEATGK